MGRNGPLFLVYPNFRVYLEWNQSLNYATTVAYLATRYAGAPEMRDIGKNVPSLTLEQAKELQTLLTRHGHDVGRIDGIVGAGTRAAVKKEQLRLGLIPDAYPTVEVAGAAAERAGALAGLAWLWPQTPSAPGCGRGWAGGGGRRSRLAESSASISASL